MGTKDIKLKADGLSVVETTTVTRQYSLKEIKHYTDGSKCKNSLYLCQKYNDCMAILRNLINEHRRDILGTYDGYKIIVNGYGNLRYVETTEQLSSKKRISSKVIYAKLNILLGV